MGHLDDVESTVKNILSRIKKRDFSGYGGLALKNSVYQFSTSLVAKIGALIFTVILARMLMPELFGLYSLALSTILIFAAFSDFGIGSVTVRFISRELGKNNLRKAKSYFDYLLKIKMYLLVFTSFALIILAKFISDYYYHKPLFLALVAGSLYISFAGLGAYLQSALQSLNSFRGILYKEILFQASRIIIIPITTIFSLKLTLSDEKIIMIVILVFSFSYLLSSTFLYFHSGKKITYLTEKKLNLSKREKRNLWKFIFIVSATLFSGVFFGYIDMIILGRFVSSEFIGYYSVAFNLVTSAAILITFSVALFPIFSRMKRKNLELFFNKSVKTSFVISILLALFVFLFPNYIISIIFGENYILSANILRIFSLLLVSIPLTGIYSSYFTSIGKPLIVTKSLILSTIVNIVLNFAFITFLVKYSYLWAAYGAAAAGVISGWLYLSILVFKKNKN